MRVEVKLGFVENSPTAGATAAPVKWPHQLATDQGTGQRVARGRPRRNDQLPVDDLTHDVLRQAENILIGGWPGLR